MIVNNHRTAPIVAFILTALLAFAVLFGVTRTPDLNIISTPEELTGVDFLEKASCITVGAGEAFPDKLYEPSDFVNGKTPEGLSDNPDYEHYLTIRFTLPVRDNKYYRISPIENAYSSKIWIDGNLVAESGKVADNAKDFVPTFHSQGLSFTAQGDNAEIIIQQSNFNHAKHRTAGLLIGNNIEISKHERLPIIRILVLCSCFFLITLISFGMYICFPENKNFSVLAILCLTAMINRGTPSVASDLFPNMNWYTEHRIEIISRLLVAIFFLLFCDVNFNRKINKAVKLAPYIAVGCSIIFFGFTPSTIYTQYNEPAIAIVFACILPYALNLLISVYKDRNNLSYSNKLVIVGVFVCLLFALGNAVDYLFKLSFPFVIADSIIILALLNMIALFYEFRDKKEALDKAEFREAELRERNETALRLENLRKDFYADMSHELKTPLTVVAGHSALAARQIRMNKADIKTAELLEMVEREAVRLGRMVDGIKNMNLEAEIDQDKKEINVKEFLHSTADFCNPLCGKNRNSITVNCNEEIIVMANEDMIFHCLYNLIANSTRHCNGKIIEIGCKKAGEKTELYVMDHGDGMSKEMLSKAFERGFSGDSSSGIGLPLCRRIVEENGGEMNINETPGGGITVRFTL